MYFMGFNHPITSCSRAYSGSYNPLGLRLLSNRLSYLNIYMSWPLNSPENNTECPLYIEGSIILKANRVPNQDLNVQV